MVKNALRLTTLFLIGFCFFVLYRVPYLAGVKSELLRPAYSGRAAVYLALLAVNVYGLIYSLERKFLLREVGRKLTHLEKQSTTDPEDLTTERTQKSHEER